MRDTQRPLRLHLKKLLEGGDAHVTFEQALEGMPLSLVGRKPRAASHTPWQILEHLRICQWDILEFSINPRHRSPAWPDGYWPASAPTHPAAWRRSAQSFRADLRKMIRVLMDPRHDLYAKVDHPEARAKHTLLREALVLADHNAYHLGELLLLRRQLGAWSR
jgi:hypothetical protein